MNAHRYRALIVPLVLLLSVAGLLLAQGVPDKMLVVNGKEIPGAVVQIEGRSYVHVEALPQITNGTLTVETNRIVLTTPSASSTAGAPPPVPVDTGLTRDFVREAIADLANMREWKAAVATAITFGIQFIGTWPGDYRDRVEEGLLRTIYWYRRHQDG